MLHIDTLISTIKYKHDEMGLFCNLIFFSTLFYLIGGAESDISINARIYDICFKACGNTPPNDDVTKNDFDIISCLNDCKSSIVNLVMKKIYDPNESIRLKRSNTIHACKRFKKKLNKISKPFKKALRPKERGTTFS
ncbi:uncharacterized protein TA21200 [Theileria annulata]|uniref:Uncharacterized protein n=1 Tax=Theileria annulata TaxID=5874 RepID=Q4UGR7_THEAN|nr:uncharacterized protein TA21200 [Theileria annulata]CAI73722.1 hypothetical protein TA21200 [Theileria annulata]|eukprot:XP_954399.1 hypothetical protein TA21200 [Theileria annulata]